MLIVVEDRNVETLAELALDVEAGRRGDVLEVDPAEDRRHRHDGPDDLVGVPGREAERERGDAGELREDERLALHHRHRGLRPDVAQSEHGGPVGDDGDGVLPDRELPDLLVILRDRAADAGDARRVREGQIVAGADRDAALHLDLAAEMHEERAVGDRADLDALQLAEVLLQ